VFRNACTVQPKAWAADACRSRTNADDRLPADPLGRVEGRDGIVEGCDVADVGPQPSVPHPPDDLTQLATIGLDDKVDGQPVGGPRPGRAGMVTSVPPARITPADRRWMSPPMTSNTRSTPPTSSSASFSRSANSIAPKSSAL
jgi:hypothetical protein